MKKFLTVLLALSVVFTYTVGTAFAANEYNDTDKATATANEQLELLAEATKAAKAAISCDGNGYVTSIAGVTDQGGATPLPANIITRAAADAAVDEVAATIKKAIEDARDEVTKNPEYSDTDLAKIVQANTSATLLADAFAEDYLLALKKQYDIDLAAAVAALNAFDPSAYSDVEYFRWDGANYVFIDYDDRAYIDGISEQELAKATKVAAQKALNEVSLAADAVSADVISAIRDIATAIGMLLDSSADSAFFEAYADATPVHQKFVTLADRKADLAKESAQMINDMRSWAQKFEEDAETWLKEEIRTSNNQTEVNKAQERLNALNGQVTTLVASFTSRFNDVKIDEYNTPKMAYAELTRLVQAYKNAFGVAYDANQDFIFTNFDKAVDELSGIETLITYANEYANVLKTTYADRSTELKYDADAIDVVLAAAIEKIQVGDLSSKDAVKNWMDQYADTIAKKSLTLAKTRMDTLNAIAEEYPESDYDDAAYESLNRWTAMKPIIDKAIADINAATTPKAVRNIKTQLDQDLAKYLTDDECDDVVGHWIVVNVAKWNGNVTDTTATKGNTFETLISTGVDTYFVGKTGYNADVIAAIKDDIKAELKAAACSLGIKAADLTTANAQAIYDAMVKAYDAAFKKGIAKAKTDAELKDAETAVMALITAIGSPVSLDSRAKIEAAQNAYDAYCAIPGVALDANDNAVKITNLNVLTAANTRLKALEKAQILDALYKLTNKNITVEDKDAIEAVAALNSAYEEYCDEIAYSGAIDKLWADYVAAAAQDFINKASKLPTTITTADKAAIDAAQAAYDEIVTQMVAMGYTEEYIEAYLKYTYGNEGYELYRNILKSKIKLDDSQAQYGEAVIAAVESLKITAGSSAVKGAITVRWTVKGDASVADGYQIYRSVKKNSGFGTKPIFTTTKQTYKNTKSLKKGTRYYYKVRAYKVVDGKTYYSDWSNKAYRIAK